MRLRIRRRRLVTLLVGVVAFGVYVLLTRHRIDEAHFKMIEKGMTYAEVEAIFGAPPGEFDWAEGDQLAMVKLEWLTYWKSPDAPAPYGQIHAESVAAKHFVWVSRHGIIEVGFDDNVRVVAKSYFDNRCIRIVPPWQRWWAAWKSK